MKKTIIAVRGGGDLASAVVHRLFVSGYRVLILESDRPSAIRRMVSFSEAVYDGESFVEGVLCQKIPNIKECERIWQAGEIPLLVDPEGVCLKDWKPSALVDGIIAKKNLGTTREMASVTIALGPGFCAGYDVDYVVETNRGHDLGRIITEGYAVPNTGVPGMVGGYARERVIHSPASGRFCAKAAIRDVVEKGAVIGYAGDTPVQATLTGVLRGIIRDGYEVHQGMKIADIDPRKEQKENCDTISDKARCIAGSVLEILLSEGLLPDRKVLTK